MKRIVVIALAVAALGTSAAMAADGSAEQKYFAVDLELTRPEQMGDPAEQEILAQHVGHLRSLYDRGVLVMAGPFMPGDEGMAVVTAASADEARGYFTSDPSVIAGRMRIDDVHEWWTPFNRLDNRTFSAEEFKALMAAEPPLMDKGGAGKPAEADGDEADDADGEAGEDMDEAGDMDADDGEDLDEADEDEDDEDDERQAVNGALVHFELPSTNFERAQAFYGKVFGWEFIPMMDSYMLFQTPGGEGGGFTKDYQPGPGGGVFYIYAADVAAKLAEAVAAGGAVAMDTHPVPGYGWIALFKDPDGNMVGLFSGENAPPGESPVPTM